MRAIWALLALAGLCVAVFLVLLFTGPHMRQQPSLGSYDAKMPRLPPTSVPVKPSIFRVPEAAELAGTRNPLEGTAAQRQRAAVYYGYYCVFCHAETGSGDGQVGQSYVPKPADLRSPRVQGLSDGELYRANLLGVGHEPVLPRAVHPDHRWYLVLHVRGFGGEVTRSR